MTTRYAVEPRPTRDTRGVFAILPYTVDCFKEPDLRPSIIGRVKARTRKEAVSIASRLGLDVNGPIWAIEVVGDDRVTILEAEGIQ